MKSFDVITGSHKLIYSDSEHFRDGEKFSGVSLGTTVDTISAQIIRGDDI